MYCSQLRAPGANIIFFGRHRRENEKIFVLGGFCVLDTPERTVLPSIRKQLRVELYFIVKSFYIRELLLLGTAIEMLKSGS